MKICLFGGTFDPPHIGHLLVAQTVCEAEGFDKVVFIPANTPHSSVVVGNEDLIFVTAKDTSWGIVGIKKNVKKSPSKKK